MYKLLIRTALNNVLTLPGADLQSLIDEGDSHSTCQRYCIINTKTRKVEVTHCNLPAALKVQAGGKIG